MSVGHMAWVALALATGWGLREWWHHRRHRHAYHEHDGLQQRLHGLSQENQQLRQWNTQLQTLCSQQTTAVWQQQKDLEERWQHITNQALVKAQKDLVSQVEPLLNQWHQVTSLRLNEHHANVNHTVTPLDTTLQDMKQCIHRLEQARVEAYSRLTEHLVHLHEGHQRLVKETNALTTAFRHPHVRGCWGEMQLRRVVELAGMLPYCDFSEQPTLATDKRQGVRPDMVIRLPGNKNIVVDAKAPVTHYLEATSALNTEEYQLKIKEHAHRVTRHIKALSDKNYWSHVPHAIDFTVLFLPGETFLSAALEADVSLVELATQRNIVLATPMTLIALLKTIAQGWKHETLSQQTHTMLTLSHEIMTHVQALRKQMGLLGKSIKQTQLAFHATSDVWKERIEPRLDRLAALAPTPSSSGPSLSLVSDDGLVTPATASTAPSHEKPEESYQSTPPLLDDPDLDPDPDSDPEHQPAHEMAPELSPELSRQNAG